MSKCFLRPTFYNSFKCIGSACEDTCCSGWNVTIDKDTYKKYKKMRPSSMQLKLKQSIELLPERNKHCYARFKMNKTGCPLLTDSGLCSIQKELGESYMCRTCKIYPRIFSEIGDFIEFSLTLSCPEIARLALCRPEGIDFEWFDESDETIFGKGIVLSNDENELESYLLDIRAFVILVLQERSFSLEERLTIVGMFLAQLDEAEAINIPAIIDAFTEELKKDSIRELLSVEIDSQIFAATGIKLLLEMYNHSFNSHRLGGLCYEAIVGYAGGENKTIDELKETFKEAKKEYYDEFMDKYGYMVENFLVMTVYTNVFPYTHQTQIEAFRALVMRYLLFKLIINGAALNRGEITQEMVLEYFQSATKEMEHGGDYFEMVGKVLDELNNNDLISLISLVRG